RYSCKLLLPTFLREQDTHSRSPDTYIACCKLAGRMIYGIISCPDIISCGMSVRPHASISCFRPKTGARLPRRCRKLHVFLSGRQLLSDRPLACSLRDLPTPHSIFSGHCLLFSSVFSTCSCFFVI